MHKKTSSKRGPGRHSAENRRKRNVQKPHTEQTQKALLHVYGRDHNVPRSNLTWTELLSVVHRVDWFLDANGVICTQNGRGPMDAVTYIMYSLKGVNVKGLGPCDVSRKTGINVNLCKSLHMATFNPSQLDEHHPNFPAHRRELLIKTGIRKRSDFIA